jgi:hypothetical protein
MQERQKMIETTGTAAKRTTTGSEFRLNLVPPEFAIGVSNCGGDELVEDGHGQTAEYLKALGGLNRFGLRPHIYEADVQRFAAMSGRV